MTMLTNELIVDNFAGGGGASLGIEQALNRSVDLAINHDAEAIEVHRANHPGSRHLREDVWAVDPVKVTAGRPVGLAWFSPDCKHFSKAKGGKPVNKKIRGLAWVVVKWAKAVRPRVIMLENVEEFQTWGPLLADGMPDPARRGSTFRRWWRMLEQLGYRLDMRQLRASAYGAPTIRRRLFIIGRRDGQPIRWPDATHGPDLAGQSLKPFRTAAECIDWSLPCPSIFERARPLAEATLRRIARGLRRFVFEAAEPFIVTCNHSGPYRERGVDEPFRTLSASRDAHGLVVPYVAGVGGRQGQSLERNLEEPMQTVCAKGDAAVVAPVIVKHNHGRKPCSGVDEPLHTVTTQGNRHAQVLAFMEQANTGVTGHGAGRPLSTIVGRGTQQRLVAAFVEQQNGGMKGHAADAPLSTETGTNHHAVAAAHLVNLRGEEHGGASVAKPAPTLTAQGTHVAEVRAFLVKYYGTAIGQGLTEPMHTATAKARMGLVTVHGQEFQVVDIGMRMLEPRELFRAQGFPDYYVIDPPYKGRRLGKTSQIRMCGNSVCPPVARAIVEANFS